METKTWIHSETINSSNYNGHFPDFINSLMMAYWAQASKTCCPDSIDNKTVSICLGTKKRKETWMEKSQKSTRERESNSSYALLIRLLLLLLFSFQNGLCFYVFWGTFVQFCFAAVGK